jgi:Zn-dependent peptidase ImmA (M78 family)
MSNSQIIHKLLNESEIKEIQDKANQALGRLKKTSQIMREDVFNILETNSKVLYYPYNDDEICAFIVRRRGKFFTFINTQIPLEKQIFAAAHELYHLWYSKVKKWELLHSVIIDNQIENTGRLNKEEAKANRFAAEFLVPKNLLVNELDARELKRETVEMKDIIGLMDVFLMPYKTIIRRLHEIEFISKKQCDQFLVISDRDENDGVMLWQKRLELCARNNQRTMRKKLGNLVDRSLEAYEQEAITFDKLAYLLSLAQQKPEQYNINARTPILPSEEEVLKMLEEEE